jgi:hypothetical protein
VKIGKLVSMIISFLIHIVLPGLAVSTAFCMTSRSSPSVGISRILLEGLKVKKYLELLLNHLEKYLEFQWGNCCEIFFLLYSTNISGQI